MGKLERSVMEVLWRAGGSQTVGQIHSSLAVERELAYNTVLTVLRRLAGKTLVAQDRDGRAHRYRAVVAREEFVAAVMVDALRELPDLRCRAAALAHLVERIDAPESAAISRALSRRGAAKRQETSNTSNKECPL
nr:BlaI/MecI/CopY family transcriptional regulator [Mycobacterium lehmannii]